MKQFGLIGKNNNRKSGAAGDNTRFEQPKLNIGRSVIACSLLACCAGNVAAISLDEQQVFLLENACTEFTNAGGAATGNLAVLCGGGGGAGTSSGGGSSTPQSAPGIVEKRLQSARGEDGAPVAESADVVTALSSGKSLFFSVEAESLDRDITDFEDGFDSNIVRITLGGDRQFSDRFVAGVALTHSSHTGDIKTAMFDGGHFDNDSTGLLIFGSYMPVEQGFVQGTIGYAAKDFDRTRIAFFEMGATAGPGPASADYDADEFSAGILAGYDFSFENVTIGPRVALDWIRTEYDGYRESGNTGLELDFSDAEATSLQSRVGVAGSMTVNTSYGVVLPQASVNWVHEFDDDQRSETFSFVDDANSIPFSFENESPDRDFLEIAVGASKISPNGWMSFLQFRAIAGHEYLDSYLVAIGLRKEL